MPSVQPALAAPEQSNSNTVLFEMMMHYKRRAEIAEEATEHARKRLKKSMAATADAQHELHEQVAHNRQYVLANERGARMIVRKHEAGLGLAACLDNLFECVDVVNETAANYNNMLGIEYIAMHKDAIFQRAQVFLEQFTDDTDEDLEADETIDLTGDTTEEEDVGEWV